MNYFVFSIYCFKGIITLIFRKDAHSRKQTGTDSASFRLLGKSFKLHQYNYNLCCSFLMYSCKELTAIYK